MICRSNVSLTTNGVTAAKPLIESEIVSIGKIVEDKNNNSDDTVIDANTYVSSDLKRYPISIPSKIKVDVIKTNASVLEKNDNPCVWKNVEEMIKKMANCIKITKNDVTNVPRLNMKSLVGVMKFLKNDRDFLSFMTNVEVNNTAVIMMTITINVGNK